MNFRGFFIGIYSLLSLIIVIILMLLFPGKIPFIRKYWALSIIKLIGMDIEQIGNIDTNANIILVNHNSMLDILILDYLHPKDIAWVTNKKLANVPIYGWIFKLPNLILINPKKKSSINILLKRSKEELSNNRPIGIFPEGTRGKINEMRPFQKGSKIIVEELKLKVQPIVLVNTRDRLDTLTMKSTSGSMKIICLDIESAVDENWFENLEKTMIDIYNKNRD